MELSGTLILSCSRLCSQNIQNISLKCYFAGFMCPITKSYTDSGMWVFFQEVMIISRKNSRVYAREGVFVTIVGGQRAESRVDVHSHMVAFVWVLYCLCVALIQTKGIRTEETMRT